MIDSKRIAKNTLFLYFRMILTMGVSLYTVRVVLNVLGVVDFGIYHVVGGLVTLFSFLSAAMSSASQRYFSHALGKNDAELLKSVFSINILIYSGIAVFALFVLETVGLWFVYNHLEVPPERFNTAVTIFHLSVVALMANILTAPFNAMIVAHEDMHLYAYTSVCDAIVRLLAASALPYLPGDKLVTYALLMMVISVFLTLVYFFISKRRYAECQLRDFSFDRSLAKEITAFTGWTLYGTLTTSIRKQGITILLNQFFNPVVVAARVIAVSIASKAGLLSQNFNVGLYPSIIKTHAAGQKREMFDLIFNGSKMTFFLMWLLTLPLLIEMEALLVLWLGEAPPYSVLFARLSLVETLLMAISHPLATAARAPGKMAVYEGTLGLMQLLVFFGAWIILKLGAAPQGVFIVAIAVSALMFFTRLWIVRGLIGISVLEFLKRVAVPVLIVIIVTFFPALIIRTNFNNNLLGQAISITSCLVLVPSAVYLFGIDKMWRLKIGQVLKKKSEKLFGKLN